MAIKVLSVDSTGVHLTDLCCLLLSVPGWTTNLMSLASLLAVTIVPGLTRQDSPNGLIYSVRYQVGRVFGFTLQTWHHNSMAASPSENDEVGSMDAKPSFFRSPRSPSWLRD